MAKTNIVEYGGNEQKVTFTCDLDPIATSITLNFGDESTYRLFLSRHQLSELCDVINNAIELNANENLVPNEP